MSGVRGLYFDGKSSQSHEVELRLLSSSIEVSNESLQLSFGLSQLKVQAPMKGCPLVFELAGGERVEVPYGNYNIDDFRSLLDRKSYLLQWMETHGLPVMGSVVGLLVFFALMVMVVVPKYSDLVAQMVRQNWANSMDEVIVKQLDKVHFSPSKLDTDRQQQLRGYLLNHAGSEVKILFREHMSPNAFALAGQTIIFTDKLIEILEKDEEILAIYLHELGHLEKRHVLSSMIATATVTGLAYLLMGDMVGINESVYGLGVLLVNSKYSRNYEEQADEYAFQSLDKLGWSRSCFSQALMRIEKFNHKLTHGRGSLLNYLSSHPSTIDRTSKAGKGSCQKH